MDCCVRGLLVFVILKSGDATAERFTCESRRGLSPHQGRVRPLTIMIGSHQTREKSSRGSRPTCRHSMVQTPTAESTVCLLCLGGCLTGSRGCCARMRMEGLSSRTFRPGGQTIGTDRPAWHPYGRTVRGNGEVG